MNLYSLILAFVALSGVGVSIWGWRILNTSRKIRQWPCTKGIINTSNSSSPTNDLLPEIIFSYQVNNKQYQREFEFPDGTHPLPEFAKAYNEKYPVGAEVDVFYNPDQPETATLEPGAQGDWMVLSLGIAMTVAGILSLILS